MHLKLSFAKMAAILSNGDEFKWVDHDLHFVLVIPTRLNSAKLRSIFFLFFSWNFASSNSTWFFHFDQNAYVHIYTTSVNVDFIPPIMCSNEQMFHIHLIWLLAIIALLHKYIHFDHFLVPGTFLIWYGFFCSVLVSVTTNVMCMFKFNIYDNG